MSKFYFPTTQKSFDTKKELVAYFKQMRELVERQESNTVCDANQIADLKDFLIFHHNDKEIFLNQFDLNDCEFFVDLPPEPRNSYKCFWLHDKKTAAKRHFSTTERAFGNPPTPLQNFRSFCSFIISNYKKSVRQKLAAEQGKDFRELDLWHQSPATKQIVDEFLTVHNLRDKLEKVISPNGLGNNVPYLLPEYAYLEQKFLDFYVQKVAANEVIFSLKDRKNG
ncbi:hypothetical protein ACKLNO_11040 [Neisseriaceae bacterium B1]